MKRNRPDTDTLDPRTTRLFAYLDGELSPVDRSALEAEAAADPALRAELRAFRSIFASMKDLESPAPPPDLEVSVIAALQTRPTPLHRLWGWFTGSLHGRPPGGPFDAILDGRLTTRQAAALSSLAARDAEAARVLAGWRRLGHELSRLPEFAPAHGFADRVMARVTVPEAPPSRTRATVWIRGLWPRRQERLAAASGIAFGPTAAVAGTAYLLFANNPLVTLSNLGSFLWDKGREAFLGVSQSLFDAGLGIPAAPGGLAGMASTPAILASLLLVGGLTLVSAWILYRNIFRTTAVYTTASERRHVSV